MNVDDCRKFFAQEVRFAANVSSPALVEAFAHVPREKFLGPAPWHLGSPEQRAMSAAGLLRLSYLQTEDPRDLYHNVVISIDPSRDINNGQPSALARWMDVLALRPGSRVYHLGCGVGYYTAIIAEVVGPSGSVVAVDVLPELAARAKENLSNYPNVAVHCGDGSTFDPGECDAMLINAGATHPRTSWLTRLRLQGRLVVPITISAAPTIGQGIMVQIVREPEGFSAQIVSAVAIYSCVGGRDSQIELLLKKSLASGALLKLKSVRTESHEPTETCLVHSGEVCLSSAEITHASASASAS
jgi:protein-L-isoaspartate(D-aspartate) O-methyltransferase